MRKLRVLHIITHLAVGGAQENTLTTCRLSDPDRVETAVLCGAPPDDEASLDTSGVTVHIMPSLIRPIRPALDVRAYHDIVAWLKRGRWDIVHTHSSKAGIVGRLAANAARVPVIVHTVHGWGHHDRQNPLMRRGLVAIERRVANITDKMIVVADANREKGLADGIGRPEQYVTIHSSINISRYRDTVVDRGALRAEFGIPQDALVVGTVSRLANQKAPWDFVSMAAAIHAKRPGTHFVFVGGGPLRARFEAEVRAAGLESVVHLLGYREDVPELLRLFDVFALTSLWEGLPRAFAQAMCAGLPIVATRVDGAPEAVYAGENGYLVPPGEPIQQAEYVLRLLDDPILRHDMGRRGLEIVDPKFCDRDMVRQIEEVYFASARERELPVMFRDVPSKQDRSHIEQAPAATI